MIALIASNRPGAAPPPVDEAPRNPTAAPGAAPDAKKAKKVGPGR